MEVFELKHQYIVSGRMDIMIKEVQKRDGRIIPFNEEKITRAIYLAAKQVAQREGKEVDYNLAEQLSSQVIGSLNKQYTASIPNVEEIQDEVVKTLIQSGHAKTSEQYICLLYTSPSPRD